jgi:hypothetical protein
MSQWHVAQEAGASISEDSHSCPSSGAASCTYQRWFRHGPMQEHVLGGSLHGHARSSSRAHQLLRFRLDCHSLPCVVGRRTGIPRRIRHCALCRQGVGSEKNRDIWFLSVLLKVILAHGSSTSSGMAVQCCRLCTRVRRGMSCILSRIVYNFTLSVWSPVGRQSNWSLRPDVGN